MKSDNAPTVNSAAARETPFPEFVWLWNRTQGEDTPALHIRMARWLEARWRGGDRRLLMLAFRSSGKSTMLGLFCVWLLLVRPDLRILVLGAELDLAKKLVRNVKRIIERHELAWHLRPARADQWGAGQFTVNRPSELRDPSMLARGIGANVTGSRADFVICDDVEVPNTSDTAPKRADLRARLSEIDYILMPGGFQLYAGTPHSYYTIYADAARAEAGETAPFLDGFTRLALPVRDSDGRSLWPERFDADHIAALQRRHGPNKFASQMMLQPVNIAAGRLDPDRIRPYDADLEYAERNRIATLTLDGRRLVSASCWWDPAYGAPGKGDGSVIAVVFTDAEGGYWLHRVQYLTVDPDVEDNEAIQQCRQVAAFAGRYHVPSVQVESNGVGKFLPGLLRQEMTATGIGCAVLPVTNHIPKERRILEGFDAVLAAGGLHAHRSVWDTSFITEMREWRPGGEYRGPDDGLDAVSGCLSSEPVRLPRLPAVNRPSWRGHPGVIAAETAFDV
ncbi:MAG: phage terminase large subunit [Alphaproteobacteria bacterium]